MWLLLEGLLIPLVLTAIGTPTARGVTLLDIFRRSLRFCAREMRCDPAREGRESRRRLISFFSAVTKHTHNYNCFVLSCFLEVGRREEVGGAARATRLLFLFFRN